MDHRYRDKFRRRRRIDSARTKLSRELLQTPPIEVETVPILNLLSTPNLPTLSLPSLPLFPVLPLSHLFPDQPSPLPTFFLALLLTISHLCKLAKSPLQRRLRKISPNLLEVFPRLRLFPPFLPLQSPPSRYEKLRVALILLYLSQYPSHPKASLLRSPRNTFPHLSLSPLKQSAFPPPPLLPLTRVVSINLVLLRDSARLSLVKLVLERAFEASVLMQKPSRISRAIL